MQEIGRRVTDALTSLLSHRDLVESERKLNEAQRIAHLGSWERDFEADTITLSDEACRIFGLPLGAVRGLKLAEWHRQWVNLIHPGDRAKAVAAYEAALRHGKPYEVEYRIILENGAERLIHTFGEITWKENGEPRRIGGSMQDITEQKQMEQALARREQQYRSLVETIPDYIVRYNTDLRRTYVNPAWEKASGLAGSEVVGVPVESIPKVPAPALAEYMGKLTQTMDTGEAQSCQFAWTNARGEALYLDYVMVPEIGDDGKIAGVLAVGRDTTARRRAEEELRRYKDHLEVIVEQRTAELSLARDAAEAANKAKSVFLATMSHELRTPLNAILGFSSLLRREPDLSEGQREKLNVINRSGDHLLTLINDVLELSKIDAGRMQLVEAPFDLTAMVRDVADMMRVRAEEKGLQLLLEIPSGFPHFIKGDEVRLRQVVINLAGNAVKFTREGSVTIRLRMKRNGKSTLQIEVEDTGPGISAEDQVRLFQPFVQLATSGVQKGTGLGLALSRQYMTLMGGTVHVNSTVGKGSVFWVDLPVELAAETDIGGLDLANAKGEVIGLAPGQPTYRILIADDQQEERLLLANLMRSLGMQVNVARNGEEAVKIYQKWHPHLVWMDCRMPVMDGLRATRIIRESPGGADVKIVAVTASVFKEQQQEMLDAGMNAVVRKPYLFEEIYDSLAEQLGVKYLYREAPLASAATAPVALQPAMFSGLPPAALAELEQALKSLDADRISAVIGQIANTDARLARTLTGYTANFDYPAILDALASAMKEEGVLQ